MQPTACPEPVEGAKAVGQLEGTPAQARRPSARAELPFVPEDRQRDQGDRDNPQNNVFAAAFFLGHSWQYNTSEIRVQVPIELH
jgi:hypothetical protein